MKAMKATKAMRPAQRHEGHEGNEDHESHEAAMNADHRHQADDEWRWVVGLAAESIMVRVCVDEKGKAINTQKTVRPLAPRPLLPSPPTETWLAPRTHPVAASIDSKVNNS